MLDDPCRQILQEGYPSNPDGVKPYRGLDGHLYRPRRPMLGTLRTMPATLAPAALCTRVLSVSSGYIMRVVLPLAMPPARAACTSSFFVRPFCTGGPAANWTILAFCTLGIESLKLSTNAQQCLSLAAAESQGCLDHLMRQPSGRL